MILRERHPKKSLINYINRFLYVEATNEEMPEVQLMPTGHIYFTVILGKRGEFRSDSRSVTLPRYFIGGQITKPGLHLRTAENYIHFGIEFKGWTLHEWLRYNLEEAENNCLPAEGIFFEKISSIIEHQPFDFENTCEKLEHFFEWKIKGTTSPISNMAKLIERKQGMINTQTLAEKTGYSDRHFRRLFRAAMGISPKDYSKVIQLNTALTAAKGNGNTLNQDLVYKGGFFDEAHFIRRFKQLLGSSPTDFLNEPDDFLETYLLRNR